MCLHLDVMHVRERSAWGNAAEDMDPCEEIMAPTEYIARITSLEQNPEKGSSLPAHNLITSVFC